MAALQPTLNMAAQPRTMAEIQGYHAVNPQAGAGPAAQNPFAIQQQPFVQQQQAAPMNPFMAPPLQPQGGGPNPFLAVPAPLQQQQQQAAGPKPPNPFDSLI
jgi:hypothetical protein